MQFEKKTIVADSMHHTKFLIDIYVTCIILKKKKLEFAKKEICSKKKNSEILLPISGNCCMYH